MVNVTRLSEYDSTRSTLLVVSLSILACVAIVLNILLIVTFARVKTVRKAQNYFLVNIAVTDILAVVVWSLPSIHVALTWDWPMGDVFCQIQGVVATFCYATNTHSFSIIALDKFLKIWWPSKHAQLYYHTVALVVIVSMWSFDVVIALFPVFGWGKLLHFAERYQCTFDYRRSSSHHVFTFVLVFVVPFVVCSALYVATFARIRHLRRERSAVGERVILEENERVPHVSFGEQLRRQNREFKYGGKRSRADDDSDSDSDDRRPAGTPTVSSYNEWARMKRTKEQRAKRLYAFNQRDLHSAVTSCATWLIYSVLWLPFIVAGFLSAHHSGKVPANLFVTVTWFTFAGVVYKPLVYMTDKRFREAFVDSMQLS